MRGCHTVPVSGKISPVVYVCLLAVLFYLTRRRNSLVDFDEIWHAPLVRWSRLSTYFWLIMYTLSSVCLCVSEIEFYKQDIAKLIHGFLQNL